MNTTHRLRQLVEGTLTEAAAKLPLTMDESIVATMTDLLRSSIAALPGPYLKKEIRVSEYRPGAHIAFATGKTTTRSDIETTVDVTISNLGDYFMVAVGLSGNPPASREYKFKGHQPLAEVSKTITDIIAQMTGWTGA
jgi:hypothetical protein